MTALLGRRSHQAAGLCARYCLIVVLAIGACMTHPNATLAVLCAALVWITTGVRQAFQALSLIVLIKYLNPELAQLPSSIGVVSWVAIFLAGARILPLVRARHLPVIGALLLFSFAALGLSRITSPAFDVSALKVLGFTWIAATVVVGFQRMTEQDLRRFWVWIVALYVAVISMSIATFPFQYIAFMPRGGGFQGVLNHAQALGPLLAPLTAWLIADVLMRRSHWQIPKIAVVAGLTVIILATQARTAIVAVAAALVLGYVAMLLKRRNFSLSPGKTLLYGSVAIVSMVLATAASPGFREQLWAFILKRGGSSVEQSFYVSRGDTIGGQWHNFLDSPLIGHGFGVYPSGLFPTPVTYFMGLPLSAPVEKGFLPTMMLEEVGLVGTLLFLPFLISLCRLAFSNTDPRWPVMFLACLFVNTGEAVFFAVNGISLFFWCLIGITVGLGAHSRARS